MAARRSTGINNVKAPSEQSTSPSSTSVARESPSGVEAAADVQDHVSLSASHEADTPKPKSRSSFRNPYTKIKPGFSGDVDLHMSKQVTDEERRNWTGWCEVESEPAFFNVMLKDLGVKHVKVQEVLGLEPELLRMLSRPVYGLIFLFEFKQDDPELQESTCPDHIWFANQTTSNACATIALLNIIFNVSSVDIGPSLSSLKDLSMAMDPPMRGYTVGNDDFIRNTHNQFVQRMDMLNSDLTLANEYAEQFKNKKQKKLSKKEVDSSNGFHYSAFLPIQGQVWKLDGLDYQPTNLGLFKENWLDVIRPMIEKRMMEYEGEQIRFNLLALCASPLLVVPQKLACNIKTLNSIEQHLDRLQTDWREFIDIEQELEGTIREADATFNINKTLLDDAQLSGATVTILNSLTTTSQLLLEMRRGCILDQKDLRQSFLEELAANRHDEQRAAKRRHDWTPFIRQWLRYLSEKGALRELAEASERMNS